VIDLYLHYLLTVLSKIDREASHIIATAITTEEDGSQEEERGPEEGFEDTASPEGTPL
jgi:hypothetical protein